jgi:hypothetical protein
VGSAVFEYFKIPPSVFDSESVSRKGACEPVLTGLLQREPRVVSNGPIEGQGAGHRLGSTPFGHLVCQAASASLFAFRETKARTKGKGFALNSLARGICFELLAESGYVRLRHAIHNACIDCRIITHNYAKRALLFSFRRPEHTCVSRFESELRRPRCLHCGRSFSARWGKPG